jgi:hypothetical protein
MKVRTPLAFPGFTLAAHSFYNARVGGSVESQQQFGWQMDFPVTKPHVTLHCDYFVMELVTYI